MTEQPSLYKHQKKRSLFKLLKLADGKKVNIARQLGITVQAVQMWFLREQISPIGARKVDAHEYFGRYMTKEELRPDVEWKD